MRGFVRTSDLFRILSTAWHRTAPWAVFAMALAVVTGCSGQTIGPVFDGGVTVDSGSVVDATTPVDSGGTRDAGDAATVRDTGTPDANDAGDAAVETHSVGGTVTGLAGRNLVLRVNGRDDLPVTGNGSFTFPTHLPVGTAYAVTVATQPTQPSQECAVTNGSGQVRQADVTNVTVTCATRAFTVGGTVTGLVGTGLSLRSGSEVLRISINGGFTFVSPVASGTPFAVVVESQPSTPTQACTVTGGAGTVGAGNVTTVVVNCALNSYTVSGTVEGLEGTVVLRNGGGDDVSVSSNGTFAFPTPVDSGDTYSVTVATSPTSPAQTCTVLGGVGVVQNANVTGVYVLCTTDRHTIGGTVTGLQGTVVLKNGTDNLTVTQNGAFTFARSSASGTTYGVSVVGQPSSPAQTCTVTDGAGTIGNADVTSVAVTCTTRSFVLGGSVNGLSGQGLVLRVNGGDDLPVSGTTFAFPTALLSGTTYSVTVAAQPSGPTQTCTVSGGSGTIGGADITSVTVNCSTDSFTIGGTVSGLAGTVVLSNGGNDTLTATANGTFAFARPLARGANYSVTVVGQPQSPAQSCVVTSGDGVVGAADVTNVSVVCTTRTFTVGGSVTGLASGATVTLQNNGGTGVPVTSNGAFAFPAQASGSTYNVTVATHPSSPAQTCVVTNGGGTVGGANVTAVGVTCTTNTYRVSGTVTGLSSLGLVLSNGADEIAVGANGSFTFPVRVASGATYDVRVKTQPTAPSQTCTVTAGTGPVGSADVSSVQVSCATNSYTIGGTVSGLEGILVLQATGGGGSILSVSSGAFAFPALPSGTVYSVSVAAQPTSPSQTCTVTAGGVGVIGNGNVSNVAVSCTTNRFAVGGFVAGLPMGESVVLRNSGGDEITLDQNGSFFFPTTVLSGRSYSVSVESTSGSFTCTPSNASGTVGESNVTNVGITCN
ncbi:MAG: hypothetical protein U0169_26205 [Polyangiaceae bacterium]